METPTDGLALTPRREEILRQIDDGQIFMMGELGENVLQFLTVASFGHQIVDDQDSPVGLGTIYPTRLPLGASLRENAPPAFAGRASIYCERHNNNARWVGRV